MFRSAGTPEQALEMEERPAEVHPGTYRSFPIHTQMLIANAVYPDHPKRADSEGGDERTGRNFVPRGSTKRL